MRIKSPKKYYFIGGRNFILFFHVTKKYVTERRSEKVKIEFKFDLNVQF